MNDDAHERIGFREIDENGHAVRAVSPNVPEAVEPERKRVVINPFIAGLWAVAAGLVVFCVWAYSEASALMQPSSAFEGPPTAQINFVVLSSVPYVSLGALLLVVGLLFWHANQWQKKREHPRT